MCIDDDRFLRLREVLWLTGLSRSSVYRMMEAGIFPASKSLGDRAVGWRARHVKEWLDSRS